MDRLERCPLTCYSAGDLRAEYQYDATQPLRIQDPAKDLMWRYPRGPRANVIEFQTVQSRRRQGQRGTPDGDAVRVEDLKHPISYLVKPEVATVRLA